MILKDPLELHLLRCTGAKPTLQVYKVKRKSAMTKIMREFCKRSGLEFEVRQMATFNLKVNSNNN